MSPWAWVGVGWTVIAVVCGAWLWWEARRAPLCDQFGNPVKKEGQR